MGKTLRVTAQRKEKKETQQTNEWVKHDKIIKLNFLQ